jgi:DNA-binding beta-propeller fold protein YncE
MGRRGVAVLISTVALSAVCAGCAGSSPVVTRRTGPADFVSRGAPGCSTATQSAAARPASATAMTTLSPPSDPFGVAIAADGRWGFAALTNPVGPPAGELAVLKLSSAGRPPLLVATIALPHAATAGAVLSRDGRLLLLAAGRASAIVISVPAAEQGSKRAVIGTLSAPAPGRGAIEVAVSPDGRYAFLSLEDSDQIAVFDLEHALASGFGPGSYVGSIPTQVAPVGLAVSPDGRWLYSTSADESQGSAVGTLAVINVATAESDPAGSVVARVTAGCSPVRVITSADGSVVWVAARASDALLAFSAASLRTYAARALLADVEVGEEPVGLALVRHGSLIVVADSNLGSSAGQSPSLALVDVADALAGKHALLGYLPAGNFPRDVAADPGGDTALVANYLSHQVEAVNIDALP